MRLLTKSILAIALTSLIPACQPHSPPAQATPPPTASVVIEEPASTPAPAPITVSTPTSPPRISNKTIAGITFEGVSFDSRTHALNVVDQANGPGTSYPSSRVAALKNGGLMSINAGFFTTEGAPLGLVIANGKTSGSWNSASSLGSGIYRIDFSGKTSISRRGSRSSVSNSQELLQAGPLLIENGKAITGLDSSKLAVRSLIINDGGNRWWVGRTSSCTLAKLASALAQSSPSLWKSFHALNLDGGRSTDLFISSSIPGGPLERRGLLNRPVRNFLVLKTR